MAGTGINRQEYYRRKRLLTERIQESCRAGHCSKCSRITPKNRRSRGVSDIWMCLDCLHGILLEIDVPMSRDCEL